MKIIVTEDNWTILAGRDRHLVEAIAGEVFLDFDPIVPGWPPEKISEQSAQKQRKGETDDGQHCDQRRRFPEA